MSYYDVYINSYGHGVLRKKGRGIGYFHDPTSADQTAEILNSETEALRDELEAVKAECDTLRDELMSANSKLEKLLLEDDNA